MHRPLVDGLEPRAAGRRVRPPARWLGASGVIDVATEPRGRGKEVARFPFGGAFVGAGMKVNRRAIARLIRAWGLFQTRSRESLSPSPPHPTLERADLEALCEEQALEFICQPEPPSRARPGGPDSGCQRGAGCKAAEGRERFGKRRWAWQQEVGGLEESPDLRRASTSRGGVEPAARRGGGNAGVTTPRGASTRRSASAVEDSFRCGQEPVQATAGIEAEVAALLVRQGELARRIAEIDLATESCDIVEEEAKGSAVDR